MPMRADAGPTWPTRAHRSQRKLTKAHDSQRRSTRAHERRCRPTKSQLGHMKVHAGRMEAQTTCHVVWAQVCFLSLFSFILPTIFILCSIWFMSDEGQWMTTQAQEGQQGPTKSTSTQAHDSATKAYNSQHCNACPQKPLATKANTGFTGQC